MSRSLARSWQSLKDMGGTVGLAGFVMAAGLFAAYQFVGPPPPDAISLATGQPGGAYQAFGERYAELLAREGITVSLRETAGSVENLQLLDDGKVDIGFVQSGLASEFVTSEVLGLGALYREPLWLFLRADLALEDIGNLAGQRIAIGVGGSGTRAIAIELLKANGVDADNAALLKVGGSDALEALRNRKADAAFIVGAPNSPLVAEMVVDDQLRLFDFQRSQAYARIYRFLSPVVLPEGVLDLEDNLPLTDIRMVSPAAILAANRELHPALIDLLLVAAEDIHGGDSLLADAGDFPTPRYVDLPLSPEAERHFEFGPPFLLRYLPFWAATLVDRLWILLLPLIGLAIPLFKLVPPAYRWRVRRRLLRMYQELDSLDPAQVALQDSADRQQRYERLEAIDREVAELAVPRGYTDDVYKLRRDVDLMRRRLHSDESHSVAAGD